MAVTSVIRAAILAPLLGLLPALVFAGSAAAAPGPAPHATVAAQAPHWGTYYPGSDTVSPGGHCKGWANYSGHYVQMLGQSWGEDCSFELYRYHNGTKDLDDPRYLYGAGTLSTDGYWDDASEGYIMDIVVCDLDTGGCGETRDL